VMLNRKFTDRSRRQPMVTLHDKKTNPSVQSGAGADKSPAPKTYEFLDDGYFELDFYGNLTEVNEWLAATFGLTRDILLTRSPRHITMFIDEPSIELINQRLEHTRQHGRAGGLIPAQYRRPDGSVGYLELSLALMRDSAGQPTGFCGIARDVTVRHNAELRLDQRVHLMSILQQVDIELNHTLDIDHTLNTAMSAAVYLSRASAGGIGLIRGSQAEIVRGFGGYRTDMPFMTGGIVARVVNRRQPEWVQDVSLDPDYQAIIPATRSQITCPMIAHDKLIGVIVLETDQPSTFTNEVYEFVQLLTARIAIAIDNAQLYGIAQQQLEELRALNAQLQELEQLKSDMIRIASHDLRSPLGIIGGYLSILRDDLMDSLTPEHHTYIEAMMQGLDRIDRLTTDFLSLERLQSAKRPLTDPVDIGLLVHKAVYDAREPARLKSLTLESDLIADPLIVIGEETDLYEAIVNLLNNAIKYTPSGGRVHTRLLVEHDRVVFLVEDTGIGIPEEYHHRLFQSFFRVKTSETRDIPGTGLGLHLVKKIITRHGGSVIFQSKAGEGSIFGFTLPIARQLAEAETP
jgi:PAS domain S-box-containing protein